jgi:hypothetical protein
MRFKEEGGVAGSENGIVVPLRVCFGKMIRGYY